MRSTYSYREKLEAAFKTLPNDMGWFAATKEVKYYATQFLILDVVENYN